MDRTDYRVLLGFLLLMWGDIGDHPAMTVFGFIFIAIAIILPGVVAAREWQRNRKLGTWH